MSAEGGAPVERVDAGRRTGRHSDLVDANGFPAMRNCRVEAPSGSVTKCRLAGSDPQVRLPVPPGSRQSGSYAEGEQTAEIDYEIRSSPVDRVISS